MIESQQNGNAAGLAPESPPLAGLMGTESQVEWAERIRVQVAAEFARVAAAFRSVDAQQSEEKREETAEILQILEDKRVEVLSRTEAGYFIRDWQEITAQVRQLIAADVRYQQIQARRGLARV